MKRALATIAAATVLCACTPRPELGYAPLLPPAGEIADARTAMAVARKACHVTKLQLWLSPYRWRAELRDGIWHVRVPFFDGALNCAYANIDIRAADGAAGRCDVCFTGTVIIAGAK